MNTKLINIQEFQKFPNEEPHPVSDPFGERIRNFTKKQEKGL